MQKRNHPTVVAARKELVVHGFAVEFTPPGTPMKWIKIAARGARKAPSEAYMIGCETRARSQVWHIVPYSIDSKSAPAI